MKIIQSTLLYNYYILALQNWCSTDYKIHGLWGDVDSTHYPSYCSTISLDSIELKKSPKYDEIKKHWYDCTEEQTLTLYTHEWEKHGTCISKQTGFSQNEYFEKTLELYTKYSKNGSDSSDVYICFDLNFVKIECL